MKSSLLLVLLITIYTWSTQSFRVQKDALNRNVNANAKNEDLNCCCKKEYCGPRSKKTSTSHPVFSPNHGLCCKFKSWGCGSLLNGRTWYTLPAPDGNQDFCKTPQTSRFHDDSQESSANVPATPVEELVAGTPEHTVQSYCDFGHDVDVEDEGKDAEAPQASAKSAMVRQLVQELSKNSLDAMAKDIFSMYVCMRWAPTPAFVKTADGEMKNDQLKPMTSAYNHFEGFTFIPLRCSKNVNVYGNSKQLGETNFEVFERQMQAQSSWYNAESTGVVAKRLQNMQELPVEELQEAAAIFDIKQVRAAVATCVQNGDVAKNFTVNTVTASASEIFADCPAANWWLAKLSDWHKSMPFTSFMTPDSKVAAETKPKSNEHVLVCFGKRVSSQLHRRAEGGHLITDQSMVGCHGFWKFTDAANMLDRIVKLWRPPTCQLAAMELDMKVKTMELIGTMNTQLFDALPAMLDDEASHKVVDEEGIPLEAASTPGAFIGALSSVASIFDSTKSQYVRLGQLLGNTVVKWVVCPLKPIEDKKELAKLDMALGSEDDLARYYAQQAYAKWTGQQNLLPGEECERYEAKNGAPELPRTIQLHRCSIGEMRENMPEKYYDQDFLCPTRPLLPAKEQLEVLQKKNGLGLCAMRMDVTQMKEVGWFYRGRKPHTRQYEVMPNSPQKHYRSVKILDMDSQYDSTYYLTRTFVNIGLGCTEEEWSLTPRFCSRPEVANEPSLLRNLLTGVADGASAFAGSVGRVLQMAGVMEETPSNSAHKQRIASWLSGQVKASEGWLRSTTSSLFGREAGRYERLHARMFKQVESAELLHSMSFQDEFNNINGDSKNNRRFDRFAVMTPCLGFDPNREFRLKYSWTEKALSMARKAFQKEGSSFGSTSGGIRVQLRSDGVIRMHDATTAWISYFAHMRASDVGGEFAEWRKTSNPHILDMAGIFDGASDSELSIKDLLGYEATFACGSRVDMHELPNEFVSLGGSFRDCVKQGKITNEELRQKSPTMPFLKDEVVVRATFKPLSSCYKDLSATIPIEETVNPTYQNFANAWGCSSIGAAGDLPRDLEGAMSDGTYRGMLLGKGLPRETLLEVIITPMDFLEEISL